MPTHRPIRHSAFDIRHFILPSALCLLLSSSPSQAAPPATTPAFPADFFPIMPWDNIPSDPALFRKIKDAGMTVAGFVNAKDLPLCQSLGLKAIVSDLHFPEYNWTHLDPAAVRKNAEELVAAANNNPSVIGYYVKDEPPATWFKGLAHFTDAYRDLAPGKWAYVNLLPDYAGPGALKTKTYEEYLDQYVQTCHPPVLSYDNYSIMDDGSLRDGYYKNLESMRNASLKYHVPFWNIVLSVAHFHYREPTLSDFRFQAYTSLAYGCRGLTYFKFIAPKLGNYRSAPIDQFGDETPAYAALRNVNKQVQALAPTLLKLTSTRVYHFQTETGCHLPPADSLITDAGSPHFLAGEFTHEDGTPYLMIVNKNTAPTGSAHVALKFRASPPPKLEAISPYDGTPHPFTGEDTWLAPGQATLLHLLPTTPK